MGSIKIKYQWANKDLGCHGPHMLPVMIKPKNPYHTKTLSSTWDLETRQG